MAKKKPQPTPPPDDLPEIDPAYYLVALRNYQKLLMTLTVPQGEDRVVPDGDVAVVLRSADADRARQFGSLFARLLMERAAKAGLTFDLSATRPRVQYSAPLAPEGNVLLTAASLACALERGPRPRVDGEAVSTSAPSGRRFTAGMVIPKETFDCIETAVGILAAIVGEDPTVDGSWQALAPEEKAKVVLRYAADAKNRADLYRTLTKLYSGLPTLDSFRKNLNRMEEDPTFRRKFGTLLGG